MAKIEMDVSEYEAMKKVETLLEASLKKEETLNAEVKALQEEKIKILEENDKVVTIVNIKRTRETKLSYLSPREIVKRLQDITRTNHFGNSPQMFSVDHLAGFSRGTYDYLDTFFEATTHELPDEKIVTRKGLDEVTARLKEEYYMSLSEETKKKLTSLEDLKVELETLLENNKHLKKVVVARDKDITSYGEQLAEANEKLSTLKEKQRKLSKMHTKVVRKMESVKTIVLGVRLGIFSYFFRRRLIKALSENE